MVGMLLRVSILVPFLIKRGVFDSSRALGGDSILLVSCKNHRADVSINRLTHLSKGGFRETRRSLLLEPGVAGAVQTLTVESERRLS
jgi:hypothetical protein